MKHVTALVWLLFAILSPVSAQALLNGVPQEVRGEPGRTSIFLKGPPVITSIDADEERVVVADDGTASPSRFGQVRVASESCESNGSK